MTPSKYKRSLQSQLRTLKSDYERHRLESAITSIMEKQLYYKLADEVARHKTYRQKLKNYRFLSTEQTIIKIMNEWPEYVADHPLHFRHLLDALTKKELIASIRASLDQIITIAEADMKLFEADQKVINHRREKLAQRIRETEKALEELQ